MKITKQDFITIFMIVLFSTIINIGISYPIFNKKLNKEKGRIEILLDSTQILKDSIDFLLFEDSLILKELFPELQKREGFSDSIYFDKKGFAYQGYGHLKLKGESWPKHITKSFADSVLKEDIKKHYLIVKRLDKKGLKHRVKKMFISGNY